MGEIFFFDGSNIVKTKNIQQRAYHYTSPTGLCSIIKNKKIWFTDCQFMNDRAEYVYIKHVLVKALTQLHEKNPEKFADYLLSLPYSSIEANEIKKGRRFSRGFKICRYYLFCTSLKSDSHSLWNYFVKNGNYTGYNITINIDKFVNAFAPMSDLVLTHGKVIYDEDEQIRQIKDKVEYLKNIYEEKSNKSKGKKFTDSSGNEYDPDDIWGNEYQESLYEFLHERCLFYKQNAFESEAEYRFIIKAADTYTGQDFHLDHRTGNTGIIIPYRELNIDPNEIIEEIMISPMMEKKVVKVGLRSLLRLEYGKQFNIKFSEIDVRF